MKSEARENNAPTYLDNEFRQVLRNLVYPERYRGLDVDKWVKYCKKAGATVVFLDIKDQAYALYDTKLTPRHPILGNRDLAAELSRAAKKYGVKWGAYIAPYQLESLAAGHDDWQQRMADGSLESAVWGSKTVFCFNSGYGKLYAATLREITEKYRPHGFLFDGGGYSGWSACYCESCKEKFRRETGKVMPLKPDWSSPDWFLYIKWRFQQSVEVAELIHETIHSVDPKIAIFINATGYSYTGWYGGLSPKQCAWVDFPWEEIPPLSGSPMTSVASASYPYKYTAGEQMAFGIAAKRAMKNGKVVCAYTYYTPATSWFEALTQVHFFMAAGVMLNLQEHYKFLPRIFSRMKQTEPYLVDMVSASDVAMHFSESSHNAYYHPDDAASDKSFFAECRGIFKALLNSHIPAEIVHDDWLEKLSLSKFRSIFLPNSVYLPKEAVSNLKSYVEAGGTLITTMETGLRDELGKRNGAEILWPGSGLKFKGEIETPKPVLYIHSADGKLELEDDVPAIPDQFLIFNGPAKEWLGEDISLGERTDGVERREAMQFKGIPSCHLNTKAVEVTADRSWKILAGLRFRRSKETGWEECPAIMSRKYGKGRITYLNFQVGTLVSMTGHRWWRNLIARVLETTAGKPAVKVKAPACLKYFLWEQPKKNRYVIHLVNELSSVGMREVEKEDLIPVPAQVTISLPGVKSVKEVIGNSICSIKRKGKGWVVDYKGIKERSVLVCKK